MQVRKSISSVNFNPFHSLNLFRPASSATTDGGGDGDGGDDDDDGAPPELRLLLLPMVLAVTGAGVHSILYLYFVVKYAWNAVSKLRNGGVTCGS